MIAKIKAAFAKWPRPEKERQPIRADGAVREGEGTMTIIEKPGVANPAIAEWRMLIDGELAASSSGAVFPNINPATEEVIGVTADGTADDFYRAIAAARRTFDTTDWAYNHKF